MPEIDPADLQPRDVYLLITSIVVPRPIAWVSSLAADGTRNLAPFSFFNVASSDPPIVHFTPIGDRDTLRNVQATGEFVVNLVRFGHSAQMNVTAADLPYEEDEFDWADVGSAPSTTVAPPRVAGAPVSLECTVREFLPMGVGTMVFGDVRHVHVSDDVWRDGRVDPARFEPLGRLGGSYYAVTRQQTITSLRRPSWDGLRSNARPEA